MLEIFTVSFFFFFQWKVAMKADFLIHKTFSSLSIRLLALDSYNRFLYTT